MLRFWSICCTTPARYYLATKIEQVLWSCGDEPESNAITTLVRRLRHRLSSLNAADWVETVYRMGYRICPGLTVRVFNPQRVAT